MCLFFVDKSVEVLYNYLVSSDPLLVHDEGSEQ